MPDPRNRLQWNATCKVYPAISDLQAIEVLVQWYEEYEAPGAGDFTRPTGNVPAGKIWVITFINSWTSDPACTIYHQVRENATIKTHLTRHVTTAASEHVTHNGFYLMDEGQHFHFEYQGMAGASIMRSTLFGWQVSKY